MRLPLLVSKMLLIVTSLQIVSRVPGARSQEDLLPDDKDKEPDNNSEKKSINQKDLDRTPILPPNGVKTYGETDCLNWQEVASKYYSDISPPEKKIAIEAKLCRLDHNLECLPTNGSITNPKTRRRRRRQSPGLAGGGGDDSSDVKGKDSHQHDTDDDSEEKALPSTICGCMISIGSKPVRINGKCYIPAGSGWESECISNINGTPSEPGFPLPYGDARGPGIDPNIEEDELILDNGNHHKIKYLDWNSIIPPCVPNAVCKEGDSYRGRRCQCIKGSSLDRSDSTCSKATPSILLHGTTFNTLYHIILTTTTTTFLFGIWFRVTIFWIF